MSRKRYGTELPKTRAARVYPTRKRVADLKTTTLGLVPKEAFALAQKLLEACEDGTLPENGLIEVTAKVSSGLVTVSTDGRKVKGA